MNSTTAQSSASNEGRAWGPGKRLAVGLLLAIVVVLPFLALFVLSYGAVVGEEFSPDRFRRRSYNYFEIPVIHLQLTPLQKQDRTNDLETYLTTKKLIQPASQAKPRWDLVEIRRGDIPAPPGDAKILSRYLDLRDEENELVWLKWTKKNSAKAKALWPAVADAARYEMYVLVPELFHLAQQSANAAQLQKQISRRLARRYAHFASVQQKLGRHDRAVELFDAALEHDPNSASAREGRKESLAAREKASEQPTPAR